MSIQVASIQIQVPFNNYSQMIDQYNRLFTEYKERCGNSDFICLPEYWNGLTDEPLVDKFAGKSLTYLREQAKTLNSFIIGSQLLRLDTSVFVNRCYIIDKNGDTQGIYDKKHPFGHEKKRNILAGANEFVFRYQDWNIACKICSDLWHTADFQILLDHEVDLLFVPTMSVVPKKSLTRYGKELWHCLSVTRAKEGSMGIVVSDKALTSYNDDVWTCGASNITDPSVRSASNISVFDSIAKTLSPEKTGIITRTLHLQTIREYKRYRKSIGLL